MTRERQIKDGQAADKLGVCMAVMAWMILILVAVNLLAVMVFCAS